MADKQAKLDFGDSSVDFPVLEGTCGPDVVDIRKLYGATGKFTYDPGYKSTASCESARETKTIFCSSSGRRGERQIISSVNELISE